jgi:molybdate transport system permease protein
MPIAYWVAFSEWRWKFLVEAVVALPLVLPPTVLGFYVLIGIGPASPVGRWYAAIAGTRPAVFVRRTAGRVDVVQPPFAVQPFSAAFAGVDRQLIEASWCLGESRFATFLRVVLPLSVPVS